MNILMTICHGYSSPVGGIYSYDLLNKISSDWELQMAKSCFRNAYVCHNALVLEFN
jgi:hypothetical protein